VCEEAIEKPVKYVFSILLETFLNRTQVYGVKLRAVYWRFCCFGA